MGPLALLRHNQIQSVCCAAGEDRGRTEPGRGPWGVEAMLNSERESQAGYGCCVQLSGRVVLGRRHRLFMAWSQTAGKGRTCSRLRLSEVGRAAWEASDGQRK
jgi:hypothetical protein